MLPSLERLVPRRSRTTTMPPFASCHAPVIDLAGALGSPVRTWMTGFRAVFCLGSGANHRPVASQRLKKHGRFAIARRSPLGDSLPSPCYRTLTVFFLLCATTSARTTALEGRAILSPATLRSLRSHSSLASLGVLLRVSFFRRRNPQQRSCFGTTSLRSSFRTPRRNLPS